MEIDSFKNLFCLCAVKGCKHFKTKEVIVKTTRGKGFKKIGVCQYCSYDILKYSVI